MRFILSPCSLCIRFSQVLAGSGYPALPPMLLPPPPRGIGLPPRFGVMAAFDGFVRRLTQSGIGQHSHAKRATAHRTRTAGRAATHNAAQDVSLAGHKPPLRIARPAPGAGIRMRPPTASTFTSSPVTSQFVQQRREFVQTAHQQRPPSLQTACADSTPAALRSRPSRRPCTALGNVARSINPNRLTSRIHKAPCRPAHGPCVPVRHSARQTARATAPRHPATHRVAPM